ncbi:MAG: diguanylate cyclase domain-containing protein [Thiotrichales bacterium]
MIFQPVRRTSDRALIGYWARMSAAEADSVAPKTGFPVSDAELAAWLRVIFERQVALGLAGRLFLPAILVRPDLAFAGADAVPSFDARRRWQDVVAVVSPSDLEPDTGLVAALRTSGIPLALSLDSMPDRFDPRIRALSPEFVMLAQGGEYLSSAHELGRAARGLWRTAQVVTVPLDGDASVDTGDGEIMLVPAAFRYPSDLTRIVAPAMTREPVNPAITVAQLIAERHCLGVDTPVEEIVRQLQCANLHALPVVEGGRPLGLVRGITVLSRFVTGHCTLGTRAAEVLELDFEPISEAVAAESLKHRVGGGVSPLSGDPIIVVDAQGQFRGWLRPEQVARQIAEMEVSIARYQNPLTGLPGAVPLNEHISALLGEGGLFVVAHFDVEGIKSFNDTFGYARGDEVIRFVAGVLGHQLEPRLDYLAHVGGDDFVVVFRSPDWFDRCEAILRECEISAPAFYDCHEPDARGIYRLNRRGEREFHPFFSLSVGAVPVEPGKFLNHHAIVAASAEVKLRAKSTLGGAIYIDERAHLDPWGSASKPHN